MNARCVLLVTALLPGCGADPPHTLMVKAADYGDTWPLVALQAQLGCDPPSVVYLEVNGKRYALNGKAMSAGLPRGDEVSKTGNAVALGVFIKPALALCPGQS